MTFAFTIGAYVGVLAGLLIAALLVMTNKGDRAMKFIGKVVGTQPLNLTEATLLVYGHMEHTFVKIEVTGDVDLIDRMREQYGIKAKGVPVHFGDGEDL